MYWNVLLFQDQGALLTKASMLKIPQAGPFSSKEVALSYAPNNQWFGEYYTVGGNPSCRTCGKKISSKEETNKVVIRTDVANAFQNPTSQSKEFLLRSETLRFCLNTFCHKNLPVKHYRHIMKLKQLRKVETCHLLTIFKQLWNLIQILQGLRLFQASATELWP